MAPEYGATMGFFPVDEETRELPARHRPHATSRSTRSQSYYKAQDLFGIPEAGTVRLQQGAGARSRQRQAERGRTEASAGSHRATEAQEQVHRAVHQSQSPRTASANPPASCEALCHDRLGTRRASGVTSAAYRRRRSGANEPARRAAPRTSVGDGEQPSDAERGRRFDRESVLEHEVDLGHGDVLIAAITSCTNTSNPGVMLAAGLLAKKAVERGLTVKPHVKTRWRRARAS